MHLGMVPLLHQQLKQSAIKTITTIIIKLNAPFAVGLAHSLCILADHFEIGQTMVLDDTLEEGGSIHQVTTTIGNYRWTATVDVCIGMKRIV